MKKSEKGRKIKQLLLQGKKYNYIVNELNVAKSTVAYHAKQLGLVRGHTIEQKRYDWGLIQSFYNEGYCLREVSINFNIKMSTLRDGVKGEKFQVDIIKRKCKSEKFKHLINNIPTNKILIENSLYSGSLVKSRLLKENIIKYHCHNSICCLHNSKPEWNNKNIVLHLDHINGVRNDHSIKNLQWLCPNCHSQTSTYCGRNIKNMVVREEFESSIG